MHNAFRQPLTISGACCNKEKRALQLCALAAAQDVPVLSIHQGHMADISPSKSGNGLVWRSAGHTTHCIMRCTAGTYAFPYWFQSIFRVQNPQQTQAPNSQTRPGYVRITTVLPHSLMLACVYPDQGHTDYAVETYFKC